jgi:putative ABC transport system permease protein
MFRHYLIAAWRNMMANRLQSTIAIFGLAIGLWATILGGITTVGLYSYDHFIPGNDLLYWPVLETHGPRGDKYQTGTPYNLAAYLREFPGVQATARVSGRTVTLRHGDVQARQTLNWADPNFFALYRVPVLHGDLQEALTKPDGMVVTEDTARKYFGRDDVVGQTLEIDHAHLMTIRAVIANFPANATNYRATVFGSGLASFSSLTFDAGTQGMSKVGGMQTDGTTLVQLFPGASLTELNRRASELIARFTPPGPNKQAMHFERLDRIPISTELYPGRVDLLYVMLAINLVILILAYINFVNLSVARSAQRGLEVAIRKATGAGRTALIAQFLGESILQVLLALVVAIALAEWSLPAVNAFMNSGAVLDYWRDPSLDTAMLGGALTVGILAGIYPALVLSSYRPAVVRKGWMHGTAFGGAWLRQGMVGLQFAAMIALLIAAGVGFNQSRYALRQAMRVDTDQMLMIRIVRKCEDSLRDRIAALPGVKGAACSSLYVLPDAMNMSGTAGPGGDPVNMLLVPVGFGFLDLYGVKPIAGRGFDPADGDEIPDKPAATQTVHYIVNETAVRQLGYRTAQAAIGQPLFHQNALAPGDTKNIMTLHGIIVGVVKDFSFAPEMFASMAGSKQIPPAAYSVGLADVNLAPGSSILHVKLTGKDIPETLVAIDAAWKQSGALDPIDRQFLNDYVEAQEETILRQGQLFGVFAGIAALLGCMGLFGISLFTAARRTKEIGVRKAMGANTASILALLLWQFARPVLWANLVAWPVAYWAMQRWLSGFAYHVPLSWWLFPAAGAVTLLIALLTVTGQAWLVARQKPVLALRYE